MPKRRNLMRASEDTRRMENSFSVDINRVLTFSTDFNDKIYVSDRGGGEEIIEKISTLIKIE